MIDQIIYRKKFIPMRRQALVVNTQRILSAEDRDALMVSIHNQLKDGVCILPADMEGFTVDLDYLFETEVEG